MLTEYEIGTQYIPQGRNKTLCTVIDILKTYNGKGELVRTRYVATHEFCGQLVSDYDVVAPTIARGLK